MQVFSFCWLGELPFRERSKLKTVCIEFIDFQHTKLYPVQNLSLAFILEVFLKLRKVQHRYSYETHSYKKMNALKFFQSSVENNQFARYLLLSSVF